MAALLLHIYIAICLTYLSATLYAY